MNRLRFVLGHTLHSLVRGGRRTVVGLLCALVGVAAVVALQVAAATTADALTSNVRASNGGDIALVSDTAPLSARDLGTFATLQQQGRITASTAVARIRATAQASGGNTIPFEVNAVDLGTYPVGGEPTFTAPANASVHGLLQQGGDVVISSVLSDELHLSVGAHLEVQGLGGSTLAVTVRGILAQTSFEHSTIMLMRAQDAAVLSSDAPQYTAVYIDVPAGADPAPLADSLSTRFPHAQVTTVADALKSAEQQVHDFREYSLLSGLVALLVAGVGIFNAMHSVLAARRLEISMLKALGFRPGAVFVLLALEAAMIGVLGGAAGTAFGIALSTLVTSAVARFTGLNAPLHIDAGIIGLGLLLGVASTVLFSILPMVRAAQLRPLEMLRPGNDAPVRTGAAATGAVLLLTAVAFAVMAGVIVGDLGAGIRLVIGAALLCGVFGTVFAATVALAARLSAPRTGAVAWMVLLVLLLAAAATAFSVPALTPVLTLAALLWLGVGVARGRLAVRVRMAVRSLDRRRARTAVTLVAFLAGVFAMSITLTVATQLRDTVNTALAGSGGTNLLGVTSTGGAAQLGSAVRALPGLKAATVVTVATALPSAVDGTPVPARPASQRAQENDPLRGLDTITGYDLRGGTTPTHLVAVTGRLLDASDAGTHNIDVDSRTASAAHLHTGSTVTLTQPDGSGATTLHIVGVVQRAAGSARSALDRVVGTGVVADSATASALGAGSEQVIAAITVDDTQLVADSVALQHTAPGTLVVNVNDLTAVVRQILDDLVIVLAVITGLTLLAGMTVVGNGVTLAMLERRQEIAVLKAIGYGPGSVRGMVLLESAMTGLLAGSVSVVVVALGIAALARFAFSSPLSFSPGVAVTVLLVSTVIAMLAAYLASRPAVRLRPTEVLRNG